MISDAGEVCNHLNFSFIKIVTREDRQATIDTRRDRVGIGHSNADDGRNRSGGSGREEGRGRCRALAHNLMNRLVRDKRGRNNKVLPTSNRARYIYY